MLFFDRAGAEMPRTRLTQAVVARPWVIYILICIPYVLAFTGQWRVGRDSSLYRGLGHALASGRGYHFTDFSDRQIYPGLPVLLAGIEKVFGHSSFRRGDPTALPSIVLIHLFSLGCLIVTYKLVRLRFGEWAAITVVAMVALNGWYLELTNEIRDDIPFLFGMMLALYGWERLRMALAIYGDAKLEISDFKSEIANSKSDISNTKSDISNTKSEISNSKFEISNSKSALVMALVYLAIGLGIAAVMRPTFWILAAAWGLVCAWGLVRGPRRRFYAIGLGILLAAWLTMALLDPRVRGFRPLGGGYERDFIHALGRMGKSVPITAWKMIHREMSYAFFGQQWIAGVTEVLDCIVILASLLLLRRNPLWTLLVFITIAVTVLMKAVPRYYVMILPLLALSWLLLTVEVARRLPRRWTDTVLLVGVGMMIVPNLVRCCKVIAQQHHISFQADNLPKWQFVRDLSEVVREQVPPGQRIIAPGAPILAYLSGREAVMSRDILPSRKSPRHWPEHLAGLGVQWAVFPSRLYEGAERPIRELMDRGVIVATQRVAKVDDMVLARVEVHVPPPGVDWRKQPIVPTLTTKLGVSGKPRPSKEQIVRKHRREAARRHVAAQRKHRQLMHARAMERHKRHEARARKERHRRHLLHQHAPAAP